LRSLGVTGHLGYLALFALIGAESAGAPVPGETALLAGAVLARDGRYDIALVIGFAAAGAIAGDNLGYLLGRAGGRRLLERPGVLERHRRRLLEVGEPFFARHGPKAVFIGRWLLGVRLAAAWLAGIHRMPWHVFMFWNALGGIAWASSVGLLAYALGPAVERVLKVVGIAGIGVVAILALAYYLWRRGAHARSAPHHT
jgi:membrane-associated protein